MNADMEEISRKSRFYFNCLPTLLHIASVKIASHLLMDPDIGPMLDKASPARPGRRYEQWRVELWKSIEMTAEEKLPPLPPYLGNTVVKFIRPMYYHIFDWLMDHGLYFHEDIYHFIRLNMICWKSDGTIDRQKTAKKIIHEEIFHLNIRFQIACTYFFKNEITNLWNRIKKKRNKEKLLKIKNPPMRFWMKYLEKGQMKTMEELTRKYFDPLNIGPNDIPFRLSCYFSFLPQEFKQEYLLGDYYFETHKDDRMRILNEMEESELMKYTLPASYPRLVLTYCTKWPFSNNFIKAVREFSNYLTLEDFEGLLEYILGHYIEDGHDYFEIFNEFWNIIPESYRDEIKKDKKKFNIIQKTLNHNKLNDLHSLIESIENYYKP